MIAARVLRWVADKLDTTTTEVTVPVATGPIYAASNAIVTDDECRMRNEAAARLVDAETIGYAIFRVRRDGRDARITFDAQVGVDAWPSLLSVMARTVLTGDRVRDLARGASSAVPGDPDEEF